MFSSNSLEILQWQQYCVYYLQQTQITNKGVNEWTSTLPHSDPHLSTLVPVIVHLPLASLLWSSSLQSFFGWSKSIFRFLRGLLFGLFTPGFSSSGGGSASLWWHDAPRHCAVLKRNGSTYTGLTGLWTSSGMPPPPSLSCLSHSHNTHVVTSLLQQPGAMTASALHYKHVQVCIKTRRLHL